MTDTTSATTTRRAIFLAALTALLSLQPAFAADGAKPIRVILVGDSTMATKSGYGDALCERFQPQVKCINLARGGRSSGSFRAEGRWDEVQALLRDGSAYSASYVLIQFGHNDQPGKPGRSTDLVTQFPANMARYAQEVKALGAVAVLVTPLTRRSFAGAYVKDDLRPWAEATLAMARQEHVAALDLNAESRAAVEKMGPDAANTFATEPPPSPAVMAQIAAAKAAKEAATAAGNAAAEPQGTPKSTFDYTHLGAKGAAYFAKMVADELVRAIPAVAASLKAEQ